MKRVLSNILIFLAILPGLACGAATCIDAPVVSDALPCHEQAPGVDKDENLTLKMFKDCTGVELAQSGSVDVSKTLQPDLAKFVPVLWESFIGKLLYLSDTQLIRAPPADNLALKTYPPLFLTTQRLRI